MSIEISARKIILVIIGFGLVATISSFLVHLLIQISNYYVILMVSWIILLLIIGLVAETIGEIATE
ncbi:MAG: hypothetical protein ABIB43_03600 [archaeon]